MNKCFITKLQGVVDNASLLKLGELRIGFSNKGNSSLIQSIGIGVINPVSLEILGDGYFTDSNGDTNLGKKKTFTASADSINILGTCVLSIIEKYNLTILSSSSPNTNITYACIDDLKLSKALKKINLNYKEVEGDIASLENLTELKSISIMSSKVYGDIASLGKLKGLEYLNITDTKMTGNINFLSNFKELKNVLVSGPNITGNIDALNNNSKLAEFVATNTNITGDLAKLPESCYYVAITNASNTPFSWSTRSSSSKIIAIQKRPKITGIDNMLQNQAQCQSAITSSTDPLRKAITATGTRTSASDAAVQTLQSKGYTVSITPA